MSKTKTPNTKQAIVEVLRAAPEATAAQIALSAGIGRSTAGKMLAQLESDGEACRTEGGREGNRRLPAMWSLVGEQSASGAKQGKSRKPAGAKTVPTASINQPEGAKLKPNELNPLVLSYLKDNSGKGPHSPNDISKALQRSSGAVSNCLERLTKEKKVKRVVDKPRRYAVA